MTTGGWIMIAVSWMVIFTLLIFCYKKIFSSKKTHVKVSLGIDTEES